MFRKCLIFPTQAAGYTLNELLHLSRSSVLQQRTLSLQTLARIIQRVGTFTTNMNNNPDYLHLHSLLFFSQAKGNEYADLVEGSVLTNLLEAGVPTLLRYALDDSTETVMVAAIQCIHGLLVAPVEEVGNGS